MSSTGRYLEGVALFVVCLASLAPGAIHLRSRLAPAYAGVAARIADAVVLVALLILALELAGVVGVFDRIGVTASCLLVGAAAWAAGRRGPHAQAAPEPAPAAHDRRRSLVVWAAAAAVAVVGAAWLGWTAFAYRNGMETIDTLWYHLPFAARFVQLHDVRHLQYFDSDAITVFYPASSELLHAFGIVVFGGDLLSPLINLGWLSLALVSAWAIGRPWRREPHCLLGGLLALLTPGIVDTQPGGAYNDIVCLALLLASIALLVNARAQERLSVGAAALIAVPAGLAFGTKYTMIVPVLALGTGCVLLAARDRRIAHTATWIGIVVLLGGYWYLRNLVAVGNPLPPLSHLGPLSLPAPHTARTFTVGQYLGDGSVWRRYFVPGLRESLGLAWWALIVGSTLGGLLAALQGRDLRLRIIGCVTLLAGVMFLITPQLLGVPGAPVFFVDNVRYCLVPLGLGLTLLPLSRPLGGSRGSLAWLLVALLALLFTALDPGVWRSGIPVKPFASALHGTSALAGAALSLGGLLVWAALWRGRAARARVGRRAGVAVSAAGALVLVLAGGAVSKEYARHRYRASPPLPAVYAWAQHLRGTRIGIIGLPNQYPLTGPDDSNFVQYIGVRRPHGGYAPPANCAQWVAAVDRGRYRYVVVSGAPFGSVTSQPEFRWTAVNPRAGAIIRERRGTVVDAVVFRITVPLAAGSCPAP